MIMFFELSSSKLIVRIRTFVYLLEGNFFVEDLMNSSNRWPSSSTNSQSSLSPPALQQTASISLPPSPLDMTISPMASSNIIVPKSASVR